MKHIVQNPLDQTKKKTFAKKNKIKYVSNTPPVIFLIMKQGHKIVDICYMIL